MRAPAAADRPLDNCPVTKPFRGSARILISALTFVIFALTALLGTSRTATVQLSSATHPARAHSNSDTSVPDPNDPGSGTSTSKKSKAKNSKSKDPRPKDPTSHSLEPTLSEPPLSPSPRPTPVHVVPPRPAPPLIPPPPAPTVVSLTFDDGLDNQMTGAAILDRYGLKGTFYINSGTVDSPGHMALSDLKDLAGAGHEIAGHTTNHAPLTSTPPAEAARQICVDRATLTGWGFTVRSFAYPFGLFDDATAQAVQGCGYSSARETGDLREPSTVGDPACAECDLAEPIVPTNPFAVRTPGEVQPNWKVADLERVVIQASQNGGGWLPLVFHQICDGCSDISVQAQTLDSFAYWLAHAAPPRTSVKTVGDVIGGPVGVVHSAPPGSVSGVVNPSLETEPARPPKADSQGSEDPPDWRPDIPQCWQAGGYGHNTANFSRTNNAHDGSWAEQTDVTGYVDGDAKLLTKMDLGECAPNARPGESYILSSWYTSTTPAQYSVYYRTDSGLWKYWTSSPWFDAADRWTKATWATPPAPLGATALSFGLGLASQGSLVTDDYGIVSVSSPGLVSPAGKLLLAITGGILAAMLAISIVQQLKERSRRRRAKRETQTNEREEELAQSSFTTTNGFLRDAEHTSTALTEDRS